MPVQTASSPSRMGVKVKEERRVLEGDVMAKSG
jgi:hypothetical protein